MLTDQWTACSSHLFYTHDLLQGGHHGLLHNLHKCVNNANAENGHFMKDYSYLMGCLLFFLNIYKFWLPWSSLVHSGFLSSQWAGLPSAVPRPPVWPAFLVADTGSAVMSRGLRCPTACGIFWTRYQTHVPCMGRGIPNHWTTREVLLCFLYYHLTDKEGTLRGKATEVSSARLAVAQGVSSVFFWCRIPPTTR